MKTVERAIELLKVEGLEIKDNRKIGMGFAIIAQPKFKYVSASQKNDKFFLNVTGSNSTIGEARILISELTKMTYLIKTINEAIEDNL